MAADVSAGRRRSASISIVTSAWPGDDVDVGDLADGDAGDLDVVADEQAGDVVEGGVQRGGLLASPDQSASVVLPMVDGQVQQEHHAQGDEEPELDRGAGHRAPPARSRSSSEFFGSVAAVAAPGAGGGTTPSTPG